MRKPLVAITVLAIAVAASPAFGQAQQTTLIPIQNFVPMDAANEPVVAVGNGYYAGPSQLWAPLTVPMGVAVDQVCVEVFDNTNTSQVIVQLWGAEAAQGLSASPPVLLAAANSGGSETPGGTSVCLIPEGGFSFPFTVRATGNIDGLGSPGTVQYYLEAVLPDSGFSTLVGPALVTWRRLVSDPPVTATFDDVSTNDPFYQYVEALAAAGIAESCDGGTHFCPDNPVTRKQMALYLARALGLFFPN